MLSLFVASRYLTLVGQASVYGSNLPSYPQLGHFRRKALSGHPLCVDTNSQGRGCSTFFFNPNAALFEPPQTVTNR